MRNVGSAIIRYLFKIEFENKIPKDSRKTLWKSIFLIKLKIDNFYLERFLRFFRDFYAVKYSGEGVFITSKMIKINIAKCFIKLDFIWFFNTNHMILKSK